MMGKALYRVYRSKSFDELVGQDHITQTLKNALKQGALNHAYLLTGPRGVGKTSVARILAYSVNNLPYGEESPHIDIIEIDAASNRRIDEIRELRDKVHIAPVSAKYKVYIIDEVHMLTKEAFNALLKTLEEPPAHVIFILATTEFYKLPETIISRCLRFTFRPISPGDIKKHLKSIAKKEKIDIGDEALDLIAEHSSGSFRDSISLLEQIKSSQNTKITLAHVQHALGIAPEQMISLILQTIADGDAKKMVEALEQAYSFGTNEASLARQISSQLRHQLITGDLALPSDEAMEILRSLINVQGSKQPKVELELALLGGLVNHRQEANIPQPPSKSFETTIKKAQPKPKSADVSKRSEASTTVNDLWEETLSKIKSSNSTLYSIARMAEAETQDDTVILKFKFSFHYKQVNELKNKQMITELVRQIDPSIKAISPKHHPDADPNPASKNQKNEALGSITNIFGAGEVLES